MSVAPGPHSLLSQRRGRRLRECADLRPEPQAAWSGLLATAEDLARFGAALLRPGMLSERGQAELFRPVPLADGTATELALRFRVKDDDGRRLLHQPGGGIGISAWLFVYPDDDLVVALLSNVPTGPVGGATRRAITDAFFAAMSEPEGSGR